MRDYGQGNVASTRSNLVCFFSLPWWRQCASAIESNAIDKLTADAVPPLPSGVDMAIVLLKVRTLEFPRISSSESRGP
jgi:hypothetical protein